MYTLARHGRGGFTLIELLAVVVLIAVLLALLLPALSAVRSSSRRLQCQANLRSIGQALLSFESARTRLPAGRDAKNNADHSWATAILPFMAEAALYERYDWHRPWNDDKASAQGESAPSAALEANHAAAVGTASSPVAETKTNYRVAQTELSIFKCPETQHAFSGAMDYGGNYGSALTGLTPGFEPGNAWDAGVLLAINMSYSKDSRTAGVKLDSVTDGASHTFMVLEDAGRTAEQGGMWANGHNCFANDWGLVNAKRSNEIYSDHAKVAHALLVDGSVMELVEGSNRYILGAMSTRNASDLVAENSPSQVYLPGAPCCQDTSISQ